MALIYRSATIPGTWGEMKFSPWAIQVARTQYHGSEGESEIRGSRGGRDLTISGVWKNGYATAALLEAAIEALARQSPINGTLSRTGLIVDSYKYCTLNSVTTDMGPLPSSVHGWFAFVTLSFRQLGV